MRYTDTGGWFLTPEFAAPGARCLGWDDGLDIVHTDNPLTSAQLRALAAQMTEEADKIDLEESEHEGS